MRAHYVPSMDVDKWAAILEKNECEIIQAAYILASFDFWVDNQRRNPGQKILLKLVKLLIAVIKENEITQQKIIFSTLECVIIGWRKEKVILQINISIKISNTNDLFVEYCQLENRCSNP